MASQLLAQDLSTPNMRYEHPLASSLLAALVLLFVACGDATPEGADAGGPSPEPTLDSGTDSGSDAGEDPDAGADADAGESLDAGPHLDGGESLDAGEDFDGGRPLDAGEDVDGGAPSDAGQTGDAGTPDAGPPVPPQVVETTPVDGANDVLNGDVISVRFDLDMDATSFAGTVSVNGVAATGQYEASARRFVVTPASALVEGTQYTASVSGAVRSAAGEPLGADHTWRFTTRADQTPPRVLSTSPDAGDAEVPLHATIEATFDEPLLASSVSTSSFTLSSKTGTVTYDPTTLVARLSPSSPLTHNSLYFATLSGIRDLAGNQMPTKSWTFRAKDTTPPTVTTSLPQDGTTGVATSANTVRLFFSEAMNPSSFTSTAVTVARGDVGAVPGGPVSFTGVYDSQFRWYTLTLSPTPLVSGATYTVTAVNPQDVAGNPLAAPHAIQFTTVPDTTRPTVTAMSPGAGERNVVPSTRPYVVFSESMNPATVNATNLTLSGTPVTVSYDDTTKTATLTPTQPLTSGVELTFTAGTGLEDLYGNALASPVSRTFSTRPPALVLSDPDLKAAHESPLLAFNAQGDGVALWRFADGEVHRIMAARYAAATDSWSPPEVLTSSTTFRPVPLRLVMRGARVLAAYRTGSSTLSVHAFASGAWTAPTSLSSTFDELQLALDDTHGLAVVRDHSDAEGATFNGTSWTAVPTVLSANGTTDLVVMAQNDGFLVAGRTSTQVASRSFTSGSWSAETIHQTVSSPSWIPSLHGAANVGSYTLAWRVHQTATGEATITHRSFDGAIWSTPHVVATTGGGRVLVASGPVESMLLFKSGEGSSATVQAAHFDGMAWGSATQVGGPLTLDADQPLSVVAGGGRFTALWRRDGHPTTSVFTSGAWSAAQPLSPSGGAAADSTHEALLFESSGGPAVVFGGSTVAGTQVDWSRFESGAWTQATPVAAGLARGEWTAASGAGVVTVASSNMEDVYAAQLGSVQAPRELTLGNYPGSVARGGLARTASGDVLAAWTQFDRGVWSIVGARYDALSASWSPRFEIARGYASLIGVNASDTDFLVVYSRAEVSGFTPCFDGVFARTHANGALGIEQPLAQDCVREAKSAGGKAGFILAWGAGTPVNGTYPLVAYTSSSSGWLRSEVVAGTVSRYPRFVAVSSTSFSLIHDGEVYFALDGTTWRTYNTGGRTPNAFVGNVGNFAAAAPGSPASGDLLVGNQFGWVKTAFPSLIMSYGPSLLAPYGNGYLAILTPQSGTQVVQHEGGSWSHHADAPQIPGPRLGMLCHLQKCLLETRESSGGVTYAAARTFTTTNVGALLRLSDVPLASGTPSMGLVAAGDRVHYHFLGRDPTMGARRFYVMLGL